MGPETRIGLIRHGETEWNRQGRIQGRLNPPLNREGRRQAQAAGAALSAMRPPWQVLVTSPQLRARQTACIISRAVNLEIAACCAGLRERGKGAAEGLRRPAVQALFPDGVIPGSQPRSEFLNAVAGCMEKLVACHAGGTILAVTHGGAVRAALAALVDPTLVADVWPGNAHLTVLVRTGRGWAAEELNRPLRSRAGP